MERFFEPQVSSKPKKKYGKREKARIIVNAYRAMQANRVNGSTSDLVRAEAEYFGVNYTTMRYWLKHYEEWLYNPTHSHICIDGVKSEITKYELYGSEG